MPRLALLAAPLALAALVLVVTGVVELPDLEHALTELSETLGSWTYLLVGGLAFLETGAFVGLVAPGETAIVLGGVVAAHGEIDLAVVLAVAWVAAALGDIASFALGARLGRRFLLRRGPRFGVTERAAGPRRALLRAPRREGDPGRALRRASSAPSRRSWPAPRACRSAASCPGACSAPRSGRAAFTLVGYAFSESFSRPRAR